MQAMTWDPRGRGAPMKKAERKIVRIAAVGDLHCTKTSRGTFQSLFSTISQSADLLVLCGDLTDYGLPEEAQVLVGEMTAHNRIPTLAVLGNHDYHAGRPDDVRRVLVEAGIVVLDGESCELLGIGFAGAKGFAGGFGRGTLGAGASRRSSSSSRRRSTRPSSSNRPWPACVRKNGSPCCTIHQSARPSRASPSRSSRFSAAAAWKSRSTAIQ